MLCSGQHVGGLQAKVSWTCMVKQECNFKSHPMLVHYMSISYGQLAIGPSVVTSIIPELVC